MAKLAEVFVTVRARMAQFNTAIAGARARLTAFQAKTATMATAVRRSFLIIAAAVAVVVFQFARFEQAMARVKALSGATEAEFSKLEKTAKKLGATTVFSASQAAAAMANFALQGFTANEIMGAMPATLNLAAAAQIDVGEAADLAGKIMKVMGRSAQDLTEDVDILVAAFTTANTDITQLGAAFKFVGPVAKTLGLSLTDILVPLLALSDKGIQATQAGTIMRTVFSRLAGASKEATAVFKELGVALKTSEGNMRPFAKIIAETNAAFKAMGASTTDVTRLMVRAFGQRMFAGFLALLDTGEKGLKKIRANLTDVGGTAERIARIQLATLQGELTLLKSAAEGAAIELGLALKPAIESLSVSLKGLASFIGGVSDAWKRFVVSLGTVLLNIGALIVALNLLSKLWLVALNNPIVTIVALIGVAAVAFQSFSNQVRGLNEELEKSADTVIETQKADSKLLAELQKLLGVTDRTTAQQRRLNEIGRQLGNTYKDLGVIIDDLSNVTGIAAGAFDRMASAQKRARDQALDFEIDKLQTDLQNLIDDFKKKTGDVGFDVFEAVRRGVDIARGQGLDVQTTQFERKVKEMVARIRFLMKLRRGDDVEEVEGGLGIDRAKGGGGGQTRVKRGAQFFGITELAKEMQRRASAGVLNFQAKTERNTRDTAIGVKNGNAMLAEIARLLNRRPAEMVLGR